MRCPTSHGVFQCAREVGHGGECETDATLGIQGRIVTLDQDAQRELAKAATRILQLERTLHDIAQAPCSSPEKGTACACCRLHRLTVYAVVGGAS